MILLTYMIGLGLPTIIGWLFLSILERNKRVLHRLEKIAIACVLGLALSMLLVFSAHTYVHVPLSFVGFLSVMIGAIIVLGLVFLFLPKQTSSPRPYAPKGEMQPWLRWTLVILGVWMLIRTIVMATTFLTLTPTYLDDTLDNWNLRGKVFYEDQELTLVLPGEDPELSPLGVSSYPPTVPLIKSWLAQIHGSWTDPVANTVHIVWYIVALIVLYGVLRRKTSMQWSLIGTYMLWSLPLYAMHGTNPYADAFMSVHILLPIAMLYLSFSSTSRAERHSYMLISALSTGMLAGFTKNEGLLVFTPPILLIILVGLYVSDRTLTKRMIHTLSIYAAWLLACGLPWIIFKSMHNLTYGNAKPVSDLDVAWQPGVLFSVVVNTFFEGNWHLLFPLLIGLLIWRYKTAFHALIVLTSFFLIVYGGQLLLFMFTNLSVEAIRQTGYARGIVQLAPVIVLLTALLLADGVGNALAEDEEIAASDL